MLYIFDKDGTLVGRDPVVLGRRLPPTHPDHQRVLPAVLDHLERLRAGGHALAIASNINLVAYGVISIERAGELMDDCARKVGGVDAMRFSPYAPGARWMGALTRRPNPYARDDVSRKPRPGMLLDLMHALAHDPNNTVMVGDEELDRGAAVAAGIRFVHARAFFAKG